MENTSNIELSPRIYKRVEFLVKIFMAIWTWCKKQTIFIILRLKVEKLKLKDGDILIFRYNDSELPINQIVTLREKFHGIYPSLLMISIANNIKIESLDESKMKRFGWIREK